MRKLNDRRRTVEAIHNTETKLVLAVAGGGNAVITDLLDVPGASRTILEVRVPYAEAALTDLLASQPRTDGSAGAGAVSQTTAEAMAAACLARARELAPHDHVIGVACTAALVSDRAKRGDHRAHVAVALGDGAAGLDVRHHRIGLDKGTLDRAGEDRVVADAVLDVIAEACGVGSRLDER